MNILPVKYLTDGPILAELHEIHSLMEAKYPVDKVFARRHLYLQKRYAELIMESNDRGWNLSHQYPPERQNDGDWTPSQFDIEEARNKMMEFLTTHDDTIEYFRKRISLNDAIKLLYNGSII